MDNDDPKKRCRLKVKIPQVYGEKCTAKDDLPWAWNCLPYGGSRKDGHSYGLIMLPPIGASVWVMFEQGDPERPVVMGYWYGEKDATPETPDEAKTAGGQKYPDILVLKLPYGDGYPMVRFAKDKLFELYLDDKNYFSFDVVKNKATLQTSLPLNITSEKDITVTATKKITMTASTAIRIMAGTTAELISQTLTRIASSLRIQGAASHRSGFFPNG